MGAKLPTSLMNMGAKLPTSLMNMGAKLPTSLMPINRPSPESQPRPQKAVDVLEATETEPESDFLFDPKRDIGPKNEKTLFHNVETFRHMKQWNGFASAAVHLLTIFPNCREKLKLTGDDFKKMKSILDRFRTKNDWRAFSQLAADMFYLFPKKKVDMSLRLKEYKNIIQNHDYSFTKHLALLKLYPERAQLTKKEIDDTMFMAMRMALEHERSVDWSKFASIATSISILFPDKKTELKLDEECFNHMKETFNTVCNRIQWFSDLAGELAMNLTILSADRAEIDPQGRLRLTFKKPEKVLVKPRRPLPTISKV